MATMTAQTTTLYTVGDLETFSYEKAHQHQMENPHLAISLSIAEATEYRLGDRRTFDYDEFMTWTADAAKAATITATSTSVDVITHLVHTQQNHDGRAATCTPCVESAKAVMDHADHGSIPTLVVVP